VEAASGGKLVVNITAPLTDVDAKAVFAPLTTVKVLQFSSMLGLFGGFAEDATRERFYRRVRDYAGIWCCIHAHPGHIWYDLLYDKDHTDRHNRHFNGTWHIVTGP